MKNRYTLYRNFVYLTMDFPNLKKINTTQFQWLVWAAIFLISFFSTLPLSSVGQSFVFNLMNTVFYALIIYGNINWLFPRFYERNQKTVYVVLVIILLLGYGFAKAHLTSYIYNTFFGDDMREKITIFRVLYVSLSGGLIFLLSFIFRIALAYFGLKEQTEEILLQKTQAELNLLKSQVQPHFLFNTLNNIYYEAYIEAPKTAGLIERLADMMRYFVDESPKAKVFIATELNFLENYIELEKIRMKHQIALNFTKNYKEDYQIPPMLMMTFVENIFKHGIDKTSANNRIDISLVQQGDELIFKTLNSMSAKADHTPGSGIENLRRRLAILYNDQFELRTGEAEGYFLAYFKIPIR